MYLSIAQKNETKNKKQPPTNIQTRKQTSKHDQQKQTLTDNNRRKELINVHTVGFGFLLQDIWVPGKCHGINFECLIYRQQENLFKTTFNIL